MRVSGHPPRLQFHILGASHLHLLRDMDGALITMTDCLPSVFEQVDTYILTEETVQARP
jgi:hypothetical protein